jgi:hypothetical protein
MATVKFSRELRDNIRASAYNSFNKKISEANNKKPTDPMWGTYIYNEVFGADQAVLAAVPEKYLRFTNKLAVGYLKDLKVNLEFNLPLLVPMPLEHTCPLASITSSYSNLELRLHIGFTTAWDELYTECAAWRETVRKAEDARTEFTNMITSVVQAYDTLAPALRAFPPLWDYLSDSVKEKHKEVKERVKKEVVLDVDMGKLTAMATAQKMGV